MKKRNLFLLAFAAFAFAACSNDDVVDEGGGIDPKGESWVALSVVRPAATRGLNTPDKDPADGPEVNMDKVRAIFFDNAGLVTKDYTLQGGEQGAAGTAGDAFKVPSSSITVLVIVNPGATLAASYAVGTPLTTVNDAINGTVANLADRTGSGSFMMTNARGDLEGITLHPSAAAAESAPTALYVDRVVAKVRVYVASATDVADVTVDNPEWVLNVTNKKYFPMSKRVKTALATPTPFDIYGLGSYRIDPNYDNSSNVYTVNGTDAVNADYIANYNYYPSTATPAPSAWNATTASTSDVEYCLENTQNAAGNIHAYTTQVLLKAEFYPTKFYLPGDVAGAPSGTSTDSDNDWLAIGANFYALNTIDKWIEDELTKKYQHTKPSEYLTPITTAYNAFLVGIGQTPVDVTISPDAGVSAIDAATKAAAVVADFTALNGDVKTNGAAKVGNVSYYKGGLSYYKIMIKHDDSSTVLNALGEFGVVRNSVYDIHVSKFNNPGFPIIPEPDPDTPDETNEGYLSLKININEWTWYTQNEIL